jgi:AGZA family xanthine/uracil permease-like MFS transporter
MDHRGDPRNLGACIKTGALAVVLAGLAGTSPAVPFIESSTGVRAGGRTGLTAVVAGLLFIPFLFLSPLLSLVPAVATAPILVLAGVFMLKPLIYVRWERFDDAIPFFMTMILMPLTHSITQGMIWGCLSWTVLKAASGKYRQIPPALLVLDAVALALLFYVERFAH